MTQLLVKTGCFEEVFSSVRLHRVASFGSLKHGQESLQGGMPAQTIQLNLFMQAIQLTALAM